MKIRTNQPIKKLFRGEGSYQNHAGLDEGYAYSMMMLMPMVKYHHSGGR